MNLWNGESQVRACRLRNSRRAANRSTDGSFLESGQSHSKSCMSMLTTSMLSMSILNESDRPRRETQFFRDGTKTIITRNNSPDVGFETSLNPYRGCEHGCIYCYARPTHEYLGFSAGLDFESKIMVKARRAELLRAELESPRWQPQTLVMSGVTDPYQPVERKSADHARLSRSAGKVS